MAPSRGSETSSTSLTSSFTAAHQRVLARRQALSSASSAHLCAQHSANASNPLSRLPYPFTRFGQKSLEIWDVIKGREGTRPAFRVGQVDAELLDEELLELLRGQVGEGLKYYGVRALSALCAICENLRLGVWALGANDRDRRI